MRLFLHLLFGFFNQCHKYGFSSANAEKHQFKFLFRGKLEQNQRY